MEKLSLNAILLLDEKDNNDLQIIFHYLKEYIEGIKTSDFNIESVIDLKAIVDKFIQFGAPIETKFKVLIDDLNENVNSIEHTCYTHTYKQNTEDNEVTRSLIYQHLHSSFLKVYNKINLYFRNNKEELLEFDGLINYDISNKRKAIITIQEAIELIENDHTLSEKSKQKILKYLFDIIQELINPTTSWKHFLIKTSEVIIVLGALGSLTGGIESGSNLLKAKEKIETAKQEIGTTSLNLNYNNVANTFNFSTPIKIENNKILMLKQKNK